VNFRFKALQEQRVGVMGAFPDMNSCQRMTYALFSYYNNRWTRCYYRIKEIAPTCKQAA